MSSSPDLSRRAAAAGSVDPRAWITPEDLNVAPALLGLPLASPWRRALAMGLDLGLLALLSQWGSTTLLLGLAWLAWRLRRWNRATPGRPRGHWLGWGTLPALLLVGWGLWHSAWPQGEGARSTAPSSRQESVGAVEADDSPTQAGELGAAVLAAASQAAGRDARAAELANLRLEISDLKAQVHQLKAEAELDPREKLHRWWDQVGLNLAWALAYFVCWPLVWPGQTPGKRLLGLQVVELTGKPTTALLNLRRYGGYAAGMATGGLGLLQILWDANRQGLQDKVAHTAVIDRRNPQRLRLGLGEPQG